MKKMDFIIIICILAVAGILYFSGLLHSDIVGAEAVVYLDGKEYDRLSLNEDKTLTITNGKQKNTVRVEKGFAFMEEATCPDKVCINQGKISKQNETVVCLPNKVLMEIQGESESDSKMDAVAK